MTELESLFYEMMPAHIAHKTKIEGAKILAESTQKEAERQSLLTGLSSELIIQTAIQAISMRMKNWQVVH
ncbi:hypothetical protein [Klebsiella pneumoniae]|uniref:hypothetical protein n=1 Tax=Klebsiella pneumoniae TaxID=573 RepID=UPI0007CA4A9D|nr:hypothetical protein [Klebsiella pneumoniae]HCD1380262.1 hypothetical protein [Klebsiella pneumoniae subsp. pneumoniae]EIX9133890.1 hypothetical protein [Klebsiella pneumoniae]EJD6385703.1 hypothetical protein [Klebsiella pneumoniae]SAR76791.1 Uncharacterised protein [Klebsiella pneumoniae]HCD1388758.1 hypothetical protein [Klebsiella pneumoniae subsp. pneumoniae]